MDDALHALESELAANGVWARRLAGALTRDAQHAEDAAQEAWVEALKRRRRGAPEEVEPDASAPVDPEAGTGPHPRAWIAQVVRNAVRRVGRSEARRRRREGAAARAEELPSAVELAAEAELQRDLAAAVLALAEPYLSTLLLRYYRDLAPGEIARRQGVPPGTVRSRLHRGLELLRDRLDARYGDRSAWSAVPAPLAAGARPGGGDGTTVAAAAATAAGGILMGIKLKLALAGAVLVAGAAFFALRDRGAPAPPAAAGARPGDAGAALAAGSALEQAPDALVPGAASQGAARAAVAPPAAADHPRPVRARVVDPDGAGVEGATVRLSPYGEHEPILAMATTGAGGRVALVPEGGPLERARLHWSASGLRGGSRDYAELGLLIELSMAWTATLAGTVRDAATGLPLAGASVKSSGEPATSGADGSYRLEGVVIGHQLELSVRRAGYAPREVRVLVPGRGEHPLDVALERASALRARVLDRTTGVPIPGAELAEHESSPALATCDAEGYADVDTLMGAELTLVARAPGYAPLFWNCEVRTLPDAALGAAATLPLRRLAFAEGVVLDPDGRPLAGAAVWSVCDQHARMVEFSEERRAQLGLYGYSGDRRARDEELTGEGGAFRIPLSPCDDPVTVTVSSAEHPAERRGPFPAPAPGDTLRVDVRMKVGGGVQGRATRNGEAWTGGDLVALALDGAALGRADLDADGRYELHRLPPGPVRLELRARLDQRRALHAAEIVVQPGAVVERDLAWNQDLAWITGSVRAPDGSPRPEVLVSAAAEDPDALVGYASAKTAADGTFALEVAPGALYAVNASGGAVSARRAGVPAGIEDLELLLRGTGTLRLRLVDAATGQAPGALVPGVWSGTYALAWARGGEQEYHSARAAVDVYGRLAVEVEAGAVDAVLHLAGDGYARARVRGVAVPDGGESEEVPVRLERGADARLSLEAGVEALRGHVVFLLEEGQLSSIEGPFPEPGGRANFRINDIVMRLEDPLLMNQILDVEDGGLRVVRGLAPGRYHVRAYPDDLAFEPATFDLPAAGDEPIRIAWRRR